MNETVTMSIVLYSALVFFAVYGGVSLYRDVREILTGLRE